MKQIEDALIKKYMKKCNKLMKLNLKESILKTLEGIKKFMLKTGHITGKQIQAIENIKEFNANKKYSKSYTYHPDDFDATYDSDSDREYEDAFNIH